MLAARSLVIGFFAGLLLVIATRPVYELRVAPAAALEPARRPPEIVDATVSIDPARLLGTVRLAPGEHIVAIDDRPFGRKTVADLARLRAGSYVDFDIAGDTGVRRVVVLLH